MLQDVQPNHINALIKLTATECNLPNKGFPLNQVSSHSLRATGAILMLLAGFTEPEIQLRGHWSSDTWKQYIQPTIAAVQAQKTKVF
jgi:hypothetical protein